MTKKIKTKPKKISEDIVLYATPKYKVVRGEVFMDDRGFTVPGYCIINTTTDTSEAERNTLPEAIFVAQRLTTMMLEVEKATEATTDDTVPGEVPISLENDTPAKAH